MKIEEARNVKVGDSLIYMCDDYNDNYRELDVKVTGITIVNSGVIMFAVDVIPGQDTTTRSAYAHQGCFKLK